MTDTPDWNQESIDERVRALAADHYHRPEGTVPRDAMWATIVPAWQAERVIVATPRRGFRASPCFFHLTPVLGSKPAHLCGALTLAELVTGPLFKFG